MSAKIVKISKVDKAHAGMPEAEVRKVLAKLQNKFQEIYGQRLLKVMLYGSYARGRAHKDSDVDVAVVLKGKVAPGKEIDRVLSDIVDLDLQYDCLISVYFVSEKDYLTRQSPLLMNIRSEGLRV